MVMQRVGVVSAQTLASTVPFMAELTQIQDVIASKPASVPTVQAQAPQASRQAANAALPQFSPNPDSSAIVRSVNLHTIIPTRPREEVVEYRIDKGDSVFSIARKFNIKPETILWANYDTLNDNPDMIAPGMTLRIPATDGVYYKWKDGDSIDMVAKTLKVQPLDILSWSANRLDLVNPQVKPGQFVMVPGGVREFRQWVIPTIPRGKAGVLKNVLGPGACDSPEGGIGGTGSFVWPANNHTLSGNDYWSGHLGIDVAAGLGAHILAADSGVVVYAGWANGGYGNTIVIDHGNGYQTLYSHLNSVGVSCGVGVLKGGPIATAGSTGNSTGPHLHFEVRYLGGFINPWTVLP
jgi:murein DD-endopeptidase MepM/ murein hydrolase activator NlpD